MEKYLQTLAYNELTSVHGAFSCSCYREKKRYEPATNVASIGHCYDKCCKGNDRKLHFDFAFKYSGVAHECFEFPEYLDDKLNGK